MYNHINKETKNEKLIVYNLSVINTSSITSIFHVSAVLSVCQQLHFSNNDKRIICEFPAN